MSASSSWCCPFKPCGCLPRLSWLLPASCRAVHDWTHAFLLLAIVSGFSLTVRDVVVIYQTGCITNSHGHRTFCLVEVLDTMFLLPCTVQLAILIGAYGDRCHHISRAAAQRKLTQSYSTMIEEMDAQLQRFCESNVVLAERAFVDKRRDFLHFIEHCANIRAQVPGEDEDLERSRGRGGSPMKGVSSRAFSRCYFRSLAHPRGARPHVQHESGTQFVTLSGVARRPGPPVAVPGCQW